MWRALCKNVGHVYWYGFDSEIRDHTPTNG